MTVLYHLTDESLSALLDDQLEADYARVATAHLETCASCAERLAALRSVVVMLRGLPAIDPPRDFALGPRLVADPPNVVRLRRWYTWSRAAAASLAAAFVFLVGGTVYLDSAAPPSRATSAALSGSEANVSPPSAPAGAVPAVARDRSAEAPPPAAPAAPQLAARSQPAPATRAQPAGAPAEGAPAVDQAAEQVAAATSVRALPTQPPAAQPARAAPASVDSGSAALDPAAPLRVGAVLAGLLAVLALLLALAVRHRLVRSRAANLILE